MATQKQQQPIMVVVGKHVAFLLVGNPHLTAIVVSSSPSNVNQAMGSVKV